MTSFLQDMPLQSPVSADLLFGNVEDEENG